MREKKYIDRLYQEKFKDFEATPREAVWRSISAKLQEKEEKKPIITPFWSRMAGIAAVLTLILSIGDWMFPEKNPVIADEKVEGEGSNRLNFPAFSLAFTPTEDEDSHGEASESSQSKITKTSELKREISEVTSEITSAEKDISITAEKVNSQEVEEDGSVAEKASGKISIFDEIAKQEPKVVTESSKGSFEVSTHAAPIYHGNFGRGNFLDPQFNNKHSQGEITYSYGINIAYAISDKIKIRSGISKVNMSFNTNGVVYSAIIGPVPISSISMNSTPEDPEMSTTPPPASSAMFTGSDRATIGSLLPGMLNQKMGFIEVPVELEYNLIDEKFELNVIGGASTLFLDQNSVSVNSGNYSAVGKANNLNEISFSTNIGLGLDYNLSEKFKLNLEPMLKYQLNTFNSASSENQPFYLGIYSGFSYKF